MVKTRTQILVVDDEKVLAWTIGTVLSRAGYEVTTLNDPLSVMHECEQRQVDLVVSDVIMPGLSGVDLAKQLHQTLPACKVILLSGQASTLDLLVQVRAEGFDFEVYPKPIKPAELLRLVQARVGPP